MEGSWTVGWLTAVTKPDQCQSGPYAEGQSEFTAIVNLKLNAEIESRTVANRYLDYKINSVAVIGQAVTNSVNISSVAMVCCD